MSTADQMAVWWEWKAVDHWVGSRGLLRAVSTDSRTASLMVVDWVCCLVAMRVAEWAVNSVSMWAAWKEWRSDDSMADMKAERKVVHWAD